MTETTTSPIQPETTSAQRISELFRRQQKHQAVVARSTARRRKAKLRRLHTTMLKYRVAIQEAMYADFRKPAAESDISELICVNSEIRYTLRHLHRWMRSRRVNVRTPLLGSSAKIHYEPKGVCLIIGTWNFPFNLNLIPLVSAVAAGNCVIIKPSEHAPHSAALIRKIIAECFSEDEVAVVTGK